MKSYYRKKISKLERPQTKPELSTPLGRFANKASYLDILSFSTLMIFFGATYFGNVNVNHGLSAGNGPTTANFGDALYFSLVTFTSLGYGDFSPVGFGRVISSILVLSGLTSIALLIGKIASEQSLTILNLLQRSDVQRQLVERINQFDEISQITSVQCQTMNLADLEETASELAKQNQSLRSYIVFQTNQSNAVTNGNAAVLASLFRVLERAQRICIAVHKTANQNNRLLLAKRTISLAYQLDWLAEFVTVNCEAALKPKSFVGRLVYRLVLPSDSRFRHGRRSMRRMGNELTSLENWRSTQINLDVLEEITRIAPKRAVSNWPDKHEKEIARSIGISNGMVRRHISHLISNGTLQV